MGTSLWIMPPRHIAEELKKIMTIRRDKPHSSASYPLFEPHITLASVPSDLDIPLSSFRDCIPTKQRAFQVEFESVDIGDHYFRSVYITIRLSGTLDSELVNLHYEVHERLSMQPRTPNFPHLSLAYVDDEDTKSGEREAYFRELGERELMLNEALNREGDEEIRRVGLRAGLDKEWIKGFKAGEVWVVRCEGPVESWEVLEKVVLV